MTFLKAVLIVCYVHGVARKGREACGSTDVEVAGSTCLLLLRGLTGSPVAFRDRVKVAQVRLDFSRTAAPPIGPAGLRSSGLQVEPR